DFLNQVLPEKHQIDDLSYSRNEHLGSLDMDRKAIFDLYCIAKTGERFIVEIQKAKQNYFKDRSIYYASFPIQEQAKKGDWDYQLEPVYTIGILDFIFDDHKEEEALIHLVELKNQRCEVFYDKLKFIYIELPKFQKNEEELETQFDKWLYVFRHLSRLQDRPQKLQDKVFSRLFEAAEIAKFTQQEKEAYEESLKYYRDLKNVVDTSKEEGLLEGLLEGFEQGFEQGVEQGIEQGVDKRNLEIAIQMKKDGESLERIIKYTGLTKAQIERL
ncbi:MAG: Rpn family recombination-promoting nuclease/putative transposase, partial [Bacteroidota bacterium]